jgi:hypothetical protein
MDIKKVGYKVFENNSGSKRKVGRSRLRCRECFTRGESDEVCGGRVNNRQG